MHLLEHIFQTSLMPFILFYHYLSHDLYKIPKHKTYVSFADVLKFQTLFLFSNKIWVSRAGIHKMLVRISKQRRS